MGARAGGLSESESRPSWSPASWKCAWYDADEKGDDSDDAEGSDAAAADDHGSDSACRLSASERCSQPDASGVESHCQPESPARGRRSGRSGGALVS
eukprot:1893376-Rhodomonas_salina.1